MVTRDTHVSPCDSAPDPYIYRNNPPSIYKATHTALPTHRFCTDMGNVMSASFAPECTPLKEKYDTCFNAWYSDKFLKGLSIENECQDQWYEYMECVEASLVKQGIKPALDEARKEAPFENKGKPTDS